MGTFSLASYTHREPLRSGALTQSFLATHPSHARRVVLKQLLPTFATNDDIRKRWLELAAANQWAAEGSAFSVLESGEHEGAAYLSVEHVAGMGLDQLLRRQKGAPLEIGMAVRVGSAILEQLAAAQERGLHVAHADLGPHSVIVRDDGGVVLTEHGLLNALSPAEAAKVRFDKGRVPYLSPEFAKSLAGDGRSDVFATGVILFELLSGTRPFAGGTQLVLALAIAEGKRKTLHDVRPDLPEHVRHVVEAMLAHAPEERFQSAQAALNALVSGYAPAATVRDDLATWVAKARADGGGSPQKPHAGGPSHSGSNGVHAPRTQAFGALSRSGPAPGTGPVAVYAPRAPNKQSDGAPAGHRATEVLDMANLLGSTARGSTEKLSANLISPAAEPYAAATPPAFAQAADSPYAAPAFPAAVMSHSDAPPPAQPAFGVAFAPPAVAPSAAFGTPPVPPSASYGSAYGSSPAMGAPAMMPPVVSPPATFDAQAFTAPPAVAFASSSAPPPMMSAGMSPSPPLAIGAPSVQPPLALGKVEPLVPLPSSEIASRDGHTAFFKRGNAKHKQAIFVPSPLVLPPAPATPAATPYSAPAYTPPAAVSPPLAVSAPASIPAPSLLPAPALATPAGGAPWGLAPVVAGGAAALSPALPSARPSFDVALAPLPRSDDTFRDPSGTLFQMKSYAKTRTAGEKKKMPLGVAVTLAAVFGFVAVTGGYLLFRLLS